ncbi:MAG: glycosyltransferase [Planctomycetota bacterium]|jgi:glycosyltransferase involved in cell wall biosynthesis
MNIAFVLPYLAERFGGPVTTVKNIGKTFAAGGHNVSYWASVDKRDREETSSIGSAHLYDIGWPRSWYRSRGLVRGLSTGIGSIEVMHVSEFWSFPVLAASRIARANDVPYILRPAGSLEPWRLRSTRLKWLKKKAYLNLVGKTMMRNATCLHAVSSQEAEHFRLLGYRGPITIIPNGVDTSEFTMGDGSEAEAYWPELKGRPVVLFMSRLSPEKGLDLLIPVWAELVKTSSYKEALLVVAGPDDRGYGGIVETMIEKCDVGSHTLLTGMVQGAKKLALLQRADIFVLPSYSENFGIVIAEALSCGTPVLTTTGTPWKELEDIDAGRVVAPERGQIAVALRELLEMPKQKREVMGQRGRKLVFEKYIWESAAKKLEAVYKCILQGKDIPLDPVQNVT